MNMNLTFASLDAVAKRRDDNLTTKQPPHIVYMDMAHSMRKPTCSDDAERA